MGTIKPASSDKSVSEMNPLIQSEDLIPTRAAELTKRRYNRIAAVYDQMEWLMEKTVFSSWRRRLWGQIEEGNVLEIGVGTGKNIPYYPGSIELTAIDLSEGMLAKAESRAFQTGQKVDLHLMDVEALTFPSDSFDTIVASFVFCSVPDPVQGFREISRVVKPDGDIWLLEHVRINRPIIGSIMDWLNPLVVRLTGANINRRTRENARLAGLSIQSSTPLMGGVVQIIHACPGNPAE